jgi:hypothetical protein
MTSNKLAAALLLVNFAALFTSAVHAETDAERLINGCAELVDIYDEHEKARFMAAQTTSLSEAMRAGYCQGVIDEYRRNSNCQTESRMQMAKRIADMQNLKVSDTNTLLRSACHG